MAATTTVKKRSSDIDPEAELADAQEVVDRLRQQRGRLIALSDGTDAVEQELANLESELECAERAVARIQDKIPARAQLKKEEREMAEREHRAALAAKIAEADGECARLAGVADETLSEAAKSIAELMAAWNRRSAARGEMQIALGATSFDGGGSLTPTLQRAILFHLGAAGLERGTLEFLDVGYGDLEPLMAKEQPTQEK